MASSWWKDPRLRMQTPQSLRSAKGVSRTFDHARDPLISKQINDINKAEKQRREEGERGKGSEMIKLHRPFPDLRPKNDNTQIKITFNQDWLREQRKAQLSNFRKAEKNISHEKTQ